MWKIIFLAFRIETEEKSVAVKKYTLRIFWKDKIENFLGNNRSTFPNTVKLIKIVLLLCHKLQVLSYLKEKSHFV